MYYKNIDIVGNNIKMKKNKVIDEKTVDHISWLSKIEIPENEKEEIIFQLQKVLDWFKQIDEVNTEGEEPLFNLSGVENTLREDKTDNTITREEVMSNTSREFNKFFRAPKTL